MGQALKKIHAATAGLEAFLARATFHRVECEEADQEDDVPYERLSVLDGLHLRVRKPHGGGTIHR